MKGVSLLKLVSFNPSDKLSLGWIILLILVLLMIILAWPNPASSAFLDPTATPILDVWATLPARDFPNYAAGSWAQIYTQQYLKDSLPTFWNVTLRLEKKINIGAGRMYLMADVFNLFNASASDIDYYYTSRLPGEPSNGIADVHTQPTDEAGNWVGKVLHVGTGYARLMVTCPSLPEAISFFASS